MLNFLSESFGDSNKSHSFASAFENELDKRNEQNEACVSYVMAKKKKNRTKPEHQRR